MAVAVLDLHPPEPSMRALMEQAFTPHILLGMPHLTPSGLSETWLMKELGHRHWLMLARHLDMENADFRTPEGRDAYAAICATSLQHARFGDAHANDVLTIHSLLSPISRTQVSTRHRLSVGGNPIGEVELISAFVCRTRAGDNYSIARVPLPGLSTTAEGSPLAETAALLRAGTLDTHFGLRVNPTRPLRDFRFQPDPSQEFNGAGFFYFAEFQALADRAFGQWFPAMPEVTQRQVFFSGNIRPGEAVRVELMGLSADHCRSLCKLKRKDGTVIASIFGSR